jgi:diguanylate cyclase (GGDEF)-like protein
MIKYLAKIFNIHFNDTFSRNEYIDKDIELIDKSFRINPDLVKTEELLVELFPKLINEISEQIHIPINLHSAQKSNNLKWIDDLKQFKYKDILSYKFDEVFKDTIAINYPEFLSDNSSPDDNDIFISFKLDERYYYILEIEDSKWSKSYARIFYSGISGLIELYINHQEKLALKKEISTISQTLAEKERSLQIAEKAVKRKVYDLHNLVEASNDIYSILNFRQLINSALLTVIGQIGVQSAFVLMYDQSKRSYSQAFQKGFRSKDIQKLKFRVDFPLVKYFMKHNTPVYVSQLSKHKEFQSYVQKLNEYGIFILAPIIFAERVQGIIATREKLYSIEFTPSDFELFHVLVNIISISIENSQHYEAVKNLSLTDEMTNLHNYRSFISRLKEELNRAKRNQAKVSLVILDIDLFKNYNDTLGHQAGDEALREVGKVLRKTVRDEDIVSRYGGEEFCVIFPGIGKEETKNLGERIRQKIEEHKFYKEKVQPAGQLTISLGGATYPEDAVDIHDLIQKSDEALYRAKHLGRNQMQNFSSSDDSDLSK